VAVSVAWDWSRSQHSLWDTAPEEVYYYLYRWKSQKFRKMLDLGCGRGRISFLFSKYGYDVTAIDLSKDAVDFVNSNREYKVQATLGDMHNLPFKTGAFDCLIAFHVISHTDSSGISEILCQMKRVVRKGGELFFTVGSKESPSYALGKFQRIDENTILKNDEIEVNIPHYYANEENLQELLAGLDVISLKHITEIVGSRRWSHYFIHAKAC
jgi:SAM-dependent methyltransferase